MNTIEHLLACLGEEGSEISQDTSKAVRFGIDDFSNLPTPRERLVRELNDLLGVAALCVEHGILPADWQNPFLQIGKKQRVREFMDYARKVGALKDEVVP